MTGVRQEPRVMLIERLEGMRDVLVQCREIVEDKNRSSRRARIDVSNAVDLALARMKDDLSSYSGYARISDSGSFHFTHSSSIAGRRSLRVVPVDAEKHQPPWIGRTHPYDLDDGSGLDDGTLDDRLGE